LGKIRFLRAKSQSGESQEILSPFSENNLKADSKTYQELMRHIKKMDAADQMVIMMQPENEIDMLPSARDYHPLADQKFGQDVPKELMDYLVKNKQKLNPEFAAIWNTNGNKTEVKKGLKEYY
jgi:hypothetical protein